MLSRRWLRVKVLQQIYRLEQASDLLLTDLDKTLELQLQSLYQQYYFNCYLLYKIADFAHTDADNRRKKHLPTEDDKFISIRIAENPLLTALIENEPMRQFIKKQKPEQFIDTDMVRKRFMELRKTPEYREYANKAAVTIEDEFNIIWHLYNTILYRSNPNLSQTTSKDSNVAKVRAKTEQDGQLEILSDFHQMMEDLFADWLDNCEIINRHLEVSLKAYMENMAEPYAMPVYNAKDDKIKFTHRLLANYYNMRDELKEYIAPQLENWEADRLNLMDMIILKLSICELLKEPEIPVKVTFNEYIEIAKLYSTPESHKFVNGVLDRTFAKLNEAGKVTKEGRGLIAVSEKKA